MNHGISISRWMAAAALACSLMLLPANLVTAETDDAHPTLTESFSTADLSTLATRGDFHAILSTLREAPVRDEPLIAGLITDLERHHQHIESREQERRKDFDTAYERMLELQAKGELEEAMISAIEAHGLASEPQALLEENLIVALVKDVEAAVREAEREQDWLNVVSLYRTLDLLFEADGRYHKPLLEASKRLQALRMYAPDHLEALVRARQARRIAQLAKEAEGDVPAAERPAVRIDRTPWGEQLGGVELAMLRQTLSYARRRHITDPDYAPLLNSAINALRVVVHTPALAETFPTLNDADVVQRFEAQLDRLDREIAQRRNNLSFLDAAQILDRILAANARTISLPDAVLVYEMTTGVTDRLDDFSSVIWPLELESFARSFQGKFFGVGIQISIRDERLIVVSPLPDSPAQRAGLKAGDIIATVNATDTTGWSLDKAVKEITGPEGTEVILGIERVGEMDPLQFPLVRAEIPIESVRGWTLKDNGTWDHYIDRQRKIGYVRVSQFIPQTADHIDAAIRAMQEDTGLEALVLDLRFNPGGLLSSAVSVVDRFIRSGTIVSTVGPNGQETGAPFTATNGHTYRNFPVVVLINQGSASASEIVAGALQDYQRGLVIGSRSFGKGSVQDVFRLDGGKAYLKLTTQYYKLPGGRVIHRLPRARTWGVEPDLSVTMTNEQIAEAISLRQRADVLRDQRNEVDEQGRSTNPQDLIDQGIDAQLSTALLVLRTQIVADHLAKLDGQPGVDNAARAQLAK